MKNEKSLDKVKSSNLTDIKTMFLGTKQKTQELRRNIIKELLNYPEGIAIPDLAEKLGENRSKLDVNHIPIFEKLGVIEDVIITSSKGRKVVGIKLKDDLNIIQMLLMFGDVFQTKYGKKILEIKKREIHEIISKWFSGFYYKDFFDENDSVFLVEKLGYPLFKALGIQIDKIALLDKIPITRIEEVYKKENAEKLLVKSMVPKNKEEREYLTSLKEKLLRFAQFNVGKIVEKMEIAEKIEGHDASIVRDIYSKTIMRWIEDEVNKTFSEALKERPLQVVGKNVV